MKQYILFYAVILAVGCLFGFGGALLWGPEWGTVAGLGIYVIVLGFISWLVQR